MIDIAQIGEKNLSENFQKLYLFFQNIWKQPHSYIVLTSGRCFNLHELFLEYHNSQAGDPADTSSIISENALPLYVQNMVEEYIESGHFSSILIVDDLVFHGRSITEIIRGLEAQMNSILMEHNPNISCDEIYDMHRSLVAAVDITVFAINRHSLLLDYSWKTKVQHKNLLYTSQMRQLSQQLTDFMVEAGIPMTDCTLSCRLNSMPPTGHMETWVYENRREQVFFTERQKMGSHERLYFCGRVADAAKCF